MCPDYVASATKLPVSRGRVWSKLEGMRRRYRARFRFRSSSVAILLTGALIASMIGALILWPGSFLLDAAIPTICFIAFAWWRDRQ